MAEEVVVKEQLTPDMIAAGDELTKRLRSDKDFYLACSLWLYTSESNNWRMVVATPLAESPGPIHVYQRIQGMIGEDWPQHLEMHLYTISVMRSNHSFIRALHSFLGHFEIEELPGPGPTTRVRTGKRITFTRIQDVFIEDAYIYYVE
jgi:hypothetical protein